MSGWLIAHSLSLRCSCCAVLCCDCGCCVEDARDIQYRFFRDHIGLLSACLLSYVALSRLVQQLTSNVSMAVRVDQQSLHLLDTSAATCRGRLLSCLCVSPLLALTSHVLLLPLVCVAVVVLSQSVSARMWFSSLFSLAFLLFCHGTGVVFMLLIVAANFAIGSVLAGTMWCPLLTWTANALILVNHTTQHNTTVQHSTSHMQLVSVVTVH